MRFSEPAEVYSSWVRGGHLAIRRAVVSASRLTLAIAAACPGLVAPAAGAPAPAPGQLVERAEVRLVQVDVSVLDPKQSSYRSIPGLTIDHFDLRLDGKPLTPDERARATFDAICDEAGELTRPVLVVVDFNYVDGRGRVAVANALEALADEAPRRPEIYKVYGLTRQMRMLSDGFTKDTAALRKVAAVIRSISYRGDQAAEFARDPAQVAMDEWMSSPVMSFRGGSSGSLNTESSLLAETSLESIIGPDARRDLGVYEAEASLAALEGLMRAHSRFPGRKTVILFTTEKFTGHRTDRMEQYVAPIKEVAQQGFTVWPVDVMGVGGASGASTTYLSMIGAETGGASIRNTGALGEAFRRASEQLSCYYLIGLPVPADSKTTVRRQLAVNLNTSRFPELWGMRIMSRGELTVLDEATRRRNLRLSAMLSPEDYDQPRVTGAMGFPIHENGREVVPVRFRTLLSDLTWLPRPEGGYAARLLFDAVVERDSGLGTAIMCRLGSETIGALTLKLAQPPSENSRAGIAIEISCDVKADGLHTARGVITDLDGGLAGAGRSTVLFRRKAGDFWEASAPSVEAASGLDFLWRPGGGAARRDKDRTASRQVTAAQPAAVSDRIVFNYVVCGPDRARAAQSVVHKLVTADERGVGRPVVVLQPSALELEASAKDGPFCSQARVIVPEFALEPGRYQFEVLAVPGAPTANPVPAGDAPGAVTLLRSEPFRIVRTP